MLKILKKIFEILIILGVAVTTLGLLIFAAIQLIAAWGSLVLYILGGTVFVLIVAACWLYNDRD